MQVALVNVAAALLVLVAFSGATWRTPWRQLLEAFAVAYFISTCIGFPCAYLLPRLAHGFLLGKIGYPVQVGSSHRRDDRSGGRREPGRS